MADIAVQVENVSKIFRLAKPLRVPNQQTQQNHREQRSLKALDGISFSVTKGEVLGIIGLNGSGKTTLMRIVAGVYKPDFGSVKLDGRLSPLLQLGTGFQGDLDARDNIIMNGMLLGIPKSEIKKKVNQIIEYAELERFVNMKLKFYSAGMRARLAFGTAMQIDPDILLVDEVLAVGDEKFQKKSYETFRSFTTSGKTILHSSHNLGKLAEFSNRILLLHRGKIEMLGQPDDVIKKYKEIISKENVSL